MPSQSPLSRLLARAREREFLHLALDKAALALTILMGGVIVLLLAGTDILEWYWLAALGVASVGVCAHLLRKSLSSRYALAQRIDRKLQLADAISTATYFAEHPQPEKSAVCERQFREAETVASGVDVRRAFPFARSRFLVPAAALAAVAFGLFAVRYLVTGSLDLRASLVTLVYDNFFSGKIADARNQAPKRAKFDPRVGENRNPDAQLQSDRQPEELLDSQDASDSNSPGADNSKTASQEGSQKKGDNPSADQGKEDKSGDGAKSQDSSNQQSSNGKNSDSQKQGGKQGGKPATGGEKSQSLLDRMRDALSNLMDKMKQNEENAKGDQSSQQSKPGEKQDANQKSQSKQDQQSEASANQDQGQQAQGEQSSDSSNDKQSSNKTASQDSKNGIGSQDGEKALKQAQELQAMGKISEILGKRSAAVSGEVMVEVGSGKQQLKTPWQQTEANHTNAGGEIHRDEIPLSEQQFVERYFEEVHKSSKPAGNAQKN